jgi:poly(3-hydroxybutyrate) depolymerase
VRTELALGFVLATVVTGLGLGCSTAPEAKSTTPGAEAPGGGPGKGSSADGGTSSEPLEDPQPPCPAPFDASGPKEGANEGFSVGGQMRKFQLLLPPASFTGPRPILFGFHGTTENASKFITRAKLADFVAKGFIVVAPDAAGNGTFWPVWDAMRAPGTESAPNADVDLFDRLLSCTAAHHSVDTTRVFATGHSAGGIFTNRLLRSRSEVLAGGIVGSGVFDFTASAAKGSLQSMLVVVTWGGDNDTYTGTTPNGVNVPAFSFVEQASLASKYYAAEGEVAHARCRGTNLGHAWLPLNDWFSDLLISRPKGSAASGFTLPALPAGAKAACSTDPYELAPLANVTCGSTARAGCREACQLFADCAVENRTVGTTLKNELGEIGFTASSCTGCVQSCQSGATAAGDAAALSCFATKQAAAMCGPGIEGASPLFAAINECCAGKSNSNLCVNLCSSLNGNDASKAFLPTCQQIVQ